MKIYFEVDKMGLVDDYKNLPITKDNKVLGIITEAIELNYTYLLTAYIWDRYLDSEFECKTNRVCSMEIIEK